MSAPALTHLRHRDRGGGDRRTAAGQTVTGRHDTSDQLTAATHDDLPPTEVDRDLSAGLRRRGAVILALFGVLWAFAGASGLAPGGAATTVRVTAVAVTAVALALAVRSGSLPAQRPHRLPRQWRRDVGRINLLQAGGILLTIAVLAGAGLPWAVPPAVCLVVGIHFLPLARLFDQPQYRWTGIGLCLVAAAGAVALAAGAGSAAARAVVGLGAATVLVGTSVHVALRD